MTGLLEFLIFSSEFQVLNITEMTSGRILDLFDFDEDENSNLDDETVCQLDDQSKGSLGENFSNITIQSTGSLAIPDEMRDIPWDQKELEFPLSTLRKIIEETIEVDYDGCQEFCHHLRACNHKKRMGKLSRGYSNPALALLARN